MTDPDVHRLIGELQQETREFEVFMRGVSFCLRDFDGKDVGTKDEFRQAMREGYDHYVLDRDLPE